MGEPADPTASDSERVDGEAAATTLLDSPAAGDSIGAEPDASGPETPDAGDLDASDDADGPRTWIDLPISDIAVLVFAAALPVLITGSVKHFFAAPKTAMLWVAVGPGLVALVRLIAKRDRAAYWAGAFVVIAFAAAAFSASFVLSVFGDASQQTGALFVAGVVSVWALGRTLTPAARGYLITALLIGVMANAVFLWVQNIVEFPEGSIFSPGGRPEGFLGNPVYVGGLCAAGVVLAGAKAAQAIRSSGSRAFRFSDLRSPRLWLWLAALFILGGAVQISGGRASVIVAAVGVGWLAWRYRALALPGVAVLIIGVGVATVVPDSPTAVGRVADEPAKDVNVRLDVWLSGADALAERPVLGWGPGRFLEAASPRRTLTIARPTPTAVFADAHNFIVEIAVTTGVLGLLAAAGWLILSGRRSRGPLAAFCVMIALYSLVEPLNVGVTPLALLALGAADRREAGGRPWGAGWRIAVVITLIFGVLAGVRLIVGEMRVKTAIDATREGALDLESQQRGESLLPPWTSIALEGATMRSLTAASNPEQREDIYAEYEELLERDPEDFRIWEALAWRELVWGRYEDSERHYAKALELNPWSPVSLDERAAALRELGRGDEADALCERLAEFDQDLSRVGCLGPDGFVTRDQADFDIINDSVRRRVESVGVPPANSGCVTAAMLDEMSDDEAVTYAATGGTNFRVQTILRDALSECVPGFE